jgi:hypothetical protein
MQSQNVRSAVPVSQVSRPNDGVGHTSSWLPNIRQAVAEGQYEYPAGLFFGGKVLQHGPALLQDWFVKHLWAAGRIVPVDVHTGLGAYGQDSVLVEPEDYERQRKAFGERVRVPDPKVVYETRGGYPAMIARVFHSKAV